jgi:hypothetical protein
MNSNNKHFLFSGFCYSRNKCTRQVECDASWTPPQDIECPSKQTLNPLNPLNPLNRFNGTRERERERRKVKQCMTLWCSLILVMHLLTHSLPLLVLLDITPNRSPINGGILVTIVGTSFIDRTGVVLDYKKTECVFDSIKSPATSVTLTNVKCLAPPHSPGTWHRYLVIVFSCDRFSSLFEWWILGIVSVNVYYNNLQYNVGDPLLFEYYGNNYIFWIQIIEKCSQLFLYLMLWNNLFVCLFWKRLWPIDSSKL